MVAMIVQEHKRFPLQYTLLKGAKGNQHDAGITGYDCAAGILMGECFL